MCVCTCMCVCAWHVCVYIVCVCAGRVCVCTCVCVCVYVCVMYILNGNCDHWPILILKSCKEHSCMHEWKGYKCQCCECGLILCNTNIVGTFMLVMCLLLDVGWYWNFMWLDEQASKAPLMCRVCFLSSQCVCVFVCVCVCVEEGGRKRCSSVVFHVSVQQISCVMPSQAVSDRSKHSNTCKRLD